MAKRTDSEAIVPHEIYELAEERFQKTVRLALEMLLSRFMVSL